METSTNVENLGTPCLDEHGANTHYASNSMFVSRFPFITIITYEAAESQRRCMSLRGRKVVARVWAGSLA
jgi:hypothetical protein